MQDNVDIRYLEVATGEYPYDWEQVRYAKGTDGGWLYDKGNGWEPLAWGGSKETACQLIRKELDSRY